MPFNQLRSPSIAFQKRFVFLCLNSLLTNEDSILSPGYGWQSLLSRFYVLATRLSCFRRAITLPYH